MAVEIAREFELRQPPERVWSFLTSPEEVAGCLPGGKLLERVDERTFRGELGVGLGPLGATFRGEIRFDRLDEEALEVEMSGRGTGEGGTGGARMTLRSKLALLDDGGTRVSLVQSIRLSGRLASVGTGGLVRSVAGYVLGRFADCVEKRLARA